jgi:poly(hydroxyalkanoate) depolymerase family esterase
MLESLLSRLKSSLGGESTQRRRPVHGAHGESRDLKYLFRKRRYAGSRDREYLVHLPPSYRSGVQLPVVMILHGCDQDHWDIRRVADFDRIADKHGIIVVYPFVTTYDPPRMRNCWAFWSSSHNRAGGGEVEDLWQILCDVRKRYDADPNRLHVAGLSSGAAMAVALLVNRCDRIASGAEIAGLPFAETAAALGQGSAQFKSVKRVVTTMNETMGTRKRAIPLLIVHGKGDRMIDVAAATNLRDSWSRCFSVNTSKPVWADYGTNQGTSWEHFRYANEKSGGLIETFLLDHSQHGWYGGRDGRYGFSDAPNVSEKIWTFFDANRLKATERGGLFSWVPKIRKAA